MIVEILVTGAVAIAAGFAGHVEGYLMGSKIKNVTRLFLDPSRTPDSVWCTCGHAMSFHVDKKGACTEYLTDGKGRLLLNPTGMSHLRCRCRNFVADPKQVPERVKGELEL